MIKTIDGGWIRYASFSPSIIEGLKRYLGVDKIDEEMLSDLIGKKTRDDAVEFFVKAGVPVAPIYDVSEVVKDPHLESRNMFVEVNHPKAGKVKVPNFPIKFSETPGEIFSSSPLLGQNNREILSGILGYTENRIIGMKKRGVII